MVTILDYIDTQVLTCLTTATAKGLCFQYLDDNEKYPATDTDPPVKVVPNNNDEITFYHRLLNSSVQGDESISFGRSFRKKTTQKIRTVIFLDVTLFSNAVIDNFVNALPDTILGLTGYDQVYVSHEINLIKDRHAIWDEEYSKAYRDRYQTIFRVYALEYDLVYSLCPTCIDPEAEESFDYTLDFEFA